EEQPDLAVPGDRIVEDAEVAARSDGDARGAVAASSVAGDESRVRAAVHLEANQPVALESVSHEAAPRRLKDGDAVTGVSVDTAPLNEGSGRGVDVDPVDLERLNVVWEGGGAGRRPSCLERE